MAITKFYRIFAEKFKEDFNKYSTGLVKNATCSSEVVKVYCQILRGGICSGHIMQKRIYAISQQDCAATIHRW